MKDAYYFQHDNNANQDEKIIDLRTELGYEGYGIYWALVELLHQNEGVMQLHCKRISFLLQCDEKTLEKIIKDFALFEFDNGNFYSKRLLEHFDHRAQRSKTYSDNAKKRWFMQLHSNSNAKGMQSDAKDSIGKDRKVNDINISFDAFWNLYDKKVDKPKCELKWNKLKDNERQQIIDYIPKYIKEQPDKKFRKNPQTFLNNRSWENEISEPIKKERVVSW